MPIYNYEARTSRGETVSGRVEAPTEQLAAEILQRRELIVVVLERIEAGPLYARRIALFERVGPKDVATFSRQLATLFAVEVPMVSALNTLAQQTTNRRFREIIAEIAADVDAGTAFSQAVAKHKDAFSGFYVNMLRAGEAAGSMHDVLNYLADHTERQYHIASRIRGALIYPAFVLVTFIVVVVVMMVFVIPQLVEILEHSGQQLPIITRIIIAMSDFFREFWILTIVLLVAGGVGLWQYVKTPRGKEVWDAVQLRLPVVGNMLKKIYLFRFADSLATLIRGGIPITRALRITGDIVGNNEYKRIIYEAEERVRRGETIAPTFRLYEQVPPLVPQMIAVGEQSGKLDTILENVARFYQKEVDATIDTVTSLIEPVLILIMGVGVAILVAGILIPIYNLVGAL